ncbi:MAG: SPASM domain-containing protein, partial [Desulfobacteraceae bacterium]|nr:SPASM domain-containing protein [Desulfobacteraceae bacterium]
IERILRYAKDRGVAVSTVTNAVMLPKMLDLIGPEKGKINSVQVTLDGGPAFHDEQRRSQSGAPTFEQTILAVRELMKAGANAIIRIHLHPERLESARALVEYLDREKILGQGNVSAYFWSTEDFHPQVLSPQEYDLFSRLFQKVAFRQNRPPTAHFAFLKQIMEMKALRVQPVRRHCETCVAGLHCVVDSLGDIYECIDDAGRKERRIGSLAGGEFKHCERGEEYRKPHLRDKPECLKCSIALYCGGGCVNRMKARDGDPSAPFCLQVKEFVEQTLKSGFLLNRNAASGS